MEDTASSRDELVRWLYGLEISGIKLGLDNMMKLLRNLGNPEREFSSVHVAGTNGKGSTCAMIAAILETEGYRTGLYTSPHFVELEERIRVDDGQISTRDLLDTALKVRESAEAISARDGTSFTFFEITTALAFEYFARRRVEYAVVEVGLGGRLDSTNVISPLVSVITHVALEHTAYLGNTIQSIAHEKGGIIKKGIPAVTAELDRDALSEMERLAAERGTELLRMNELVEVRPVVNRWGELVIEAHGMRDYGTIRPGVWGSYQVENIGLAIAASEQMQQTGVYISDAAVIEGIRNVKWSGRLQIPSASDYFVFDSAHNPDAMQALQKSIRETTDEDLLCVLGILSDKNLAKMMPSVRGFASEVICVSPETPRARQAVELKQAAEECGMRAVTAGGVGEGMEMAESIRAGRKVVVTGSLRTVGEAMEWWFDKKGERLW